MAIWSVFADNLFLYYSTGSSRMKKSPSILSRKWGNCLLTHKIATVNICPHTRSNLPCTDVYYDDVW